MSFPPVTEMFQFTGFASHAYVFSNDDPEGPGFPIRKSTDQSLFAAPHGFSQRTTSFIASCRQGIHRMPLRHLITLINNARSSAPPQTARPKSEAERATKSCVRFEKRPVIDHRDLPEYAVERSSRRGCATPAKVQSTGKSLLYDVEANGHGAAIGSRSTVNPLFSV